MSLLPLDLVHHHGSILRSEAVPARLTRSEWQGLHDRADLIRVGGGVSRLAARPATAIQRVEAAVLGVGGTALAAGPTAAALWLRDEPSNPIHVITDRTGSPRSQRGVVVHRPRVMEDLKASQVSHLRVTNPLRALVDSAAWEPDQAEDVLIRMLRHGYFTTAAVRSLVERHSRQGHPGVRRLRQLLAAWPDATPLESVLEARMLDLIRRHALFEPVVQHRVGPYRVDVAWPTWKAAVACDGREHHSTIDRFESDRERDVVLASMGWVVWRFTWHQVTRRPDWVAARLRAALTARQSALAA